MQHELKVVTKTSAIWYHEDDRGGVVHEIFCDVTLNGRKGCGLSEFFYRFDTAAFSLLKVKVVDRNSRA